MPIPFDPDKKTLRKFGLPSVVTEVAKIVFNGEGRLWYGTPQSNHQIIDAVWCGLIREVDPWRCTYRENLLDERHKAIMKDVAFLARTQYADSLREWRPSEEVLLRDIDKPLWENEHVADLLNESVGNQDAVRRSFDKDGNVFKERPIHPAVAIAWGALRTIEAERADQETSSSAYMEILKAQAEGRPLPQPSIVRNMASSEVNEIRALVLADDVAKDERPHRLSLWRQAVLYDAVRYAGTRYMMERGTFVPVSPAAFSKNKERWRLDVEARIEHIEPNRFDGHFEPWAVVMTVVNEDATCKRDVVCLVDDDVAEAMRGHEGETVSVNATSTVGSYKGRLPLVDAEVTFAPFVPGINH